MCNQLGSQINVLVTDRWLVGAGSVPYLGGIRYLNKVIVISLSCVIPNVQSMSLLSKEFP